MRLATDVITASGHPRYPTHSTLADRNNSYSNNFNLFTKDSDVKPAFPYPVGTGLWIAGGNNHTVRYNHFWDNWRRGTMTFAVPNQLVRGPVAENEQAGCDPEGQATSNRNRFYGNVMGISPSGERKPNGTDHWWDQFGGNRANCWFQERGPAPITSSPPPPLLPNCDDGRDPDSSVGTGNPVNEAELGICAIPFVTRTYSEDYPCPWFDTPSRPGTRAARVEMRRDREAIERGIKEFCAEYPLSRACD